MPPSAIIGLQEAAAYCSRARATTRLRRRSLTAHHKLVWGLVSCRQRLRRWQRATGSLALGRHCCVLWTAALRHGFAPYLARPWAGPWPTGARAKGCYVVPARCAIGVTTLEFAELGAHSRTPTKASELAQHAHEHHRQRLALTHTRLQP